MQEADLAYVPPQDLDAEESLLGVAMQSPNAIGAAAQEQLAPADFYRASHGEVWGAILSLYNADQPTDPIAVADKLGFKDSANRTALRSYVHTVPASGNAAHYARIVKRHAVSRRLIAAGEAVTKVGYDGGNSIEEMLANAESALFTATEATAFKSAEPLGGDGLEELLSEIRVAYQTGVAITGTPTGLKSLDKVLNGLWPGQLCTLAARPAQGKSALALNFAENFADRGESVLFVTLEMGVREIRARSLSRAARIDGQLLTQGAGLTPEQAKKLGEAAKVVDARKNLFIQDSGVSTVASLRAEATRLKRQSQLGLVVVDYLQLMQGTGREDNRTQELSTITRGLKQLAMGLDIPILALSQMNRAIDARKDKRPVLSDLRESGSIEQDSDVVMFLHDEGAYDAEKADSGTTEVIVAKNRRGATDNVRVTYTRAFNSFKDLGGTT